MKGLFINNKKSQDSIYESGLMVFDNIKLSDKYELDYIEVDELNNEINLNYEFYFFNYSPSTMGWLDTRCINKIPGLVLTMVLEVSPNNAFAMYPKGHFDAYIVLDPTIKLNEKDCVYPFPRPLEKIKVDVKYSNKEIPTIGTFGFATKGKGFQHVVEAVNKEFERAIVRINIPHGTFIPESEYYAKFLGNLCKKTANSGIEVIITHEYMSKQELVNWCASNTLNCFLYDRNMPGLAATTDQCIISGRPLSISDNDTFRHIKQYLPSYPEWSLKDSIEKSVPIIDKMKHDWSLEIFNKTFENLLYEKIIKVNNIKHKNKVFFLPIKKKTLIYRLENRFKALIPLFSILRFIKNMLEKKKVEINDKLI